LSSNFKYKIKIGIAGVNKNIKMKIFYYLIAVLGASALNADTLDVEIHGVTKAGLLHLAIYDSKDVFESDKGDKPGPRPGIVSGTVKQIAEGIYRDSFEIPAGTYAIGFYIDANGNEKLDTNFLGIPKEEFGFSNNAMGAFSAPKFEAASFVLVRHKTIKIDL